jgi:hypothetical protein
VQTMQIYLDTANLGEVFDTECHGCWSR